ncbi:hypothetical protein K493DRAFT_314592 [Basidiobolus meristosporus CBS 931.73]|uniref:Uncharacterized protein n=1 Tax=Basidiobolus meristosporus CBS 931.73 TaxID=1314790 RepID=A0A1Y1YE07_9FUNG|nr:hypothetical protein K493DRAFT_314592 [Basidiobolus meristosporus CBS 931.73]|eukprot:ORX96260.1 hypothetical protein K493DRAFT_314592 [Basidiobolus meristosporus CBS 931.73]
MDDPLFGGTSRLDVLIEQIVSGVVTVFATLTAIFSVINAFTKGLVHLFFGACVVAFTLCEMKLLQWYRLGDLEPKFKYLILAQGLALLVLCVVGNVYLWS